MESGAPKSKLVMGMPLYGQAFTLQKESVNGLNAPAPRKGLAGPYTRAAGFLAYYEICDMVRTKGFAVVQDEAEPRRIGPYAVKGNQWVGYDDVAMIRYKSEYIRKMGFAGGMVWALDLDDFNGVCGQGKHPLLTTIKTCWPPRSAPTQALLTVPATTRLSALQARSRVTMKTTRLRRPHQRIPLLKRRHLRIQLLKRLLLRTLMLGKRPLSLRLEKSLHRKITEMSLQKTMSKMRPITPMLTGKHPQKKFLWDIAINILLF